MRWLEPNWWENSPSIQGSSAPFRDGWGTRDSSSRNKEEPLRDGGSAGPARADPADGRGRGPAGKGKLPAVWGRAAAGGALEPADLAGGADRSRAAGGRHAGATGLAAGSADPVSRTRRGEILRRAGPPSRRGSSLR